MIVINARQEVVRSCLKTSGIQLRFFAGVIFKSLHVVVRFSSKLELFDNYPVNIGPDAKFEALFILNIHISRRTALAST